MARAAKEILRETQGRKKQEKIEELHKTDKSAETTFDYYSANETMREHYSAALVRRAKAKNIDIWYLEPEQTDPWIKGIEGASYLHQSHMPYSSRP